MSQHIRLISTTGILLPILLLASCQSVQQSQVSVDYYKISGSSTEDLDSEIKRKGPKINGGLHAVAIARIKMFPKVTYARQGKGCRVDTAKVAVNAKVTLPKWTGRRTASRKLGKAWDNIDRYTRAHEATHVNLAFDYAKRIEDNVLALPAMDDCERLRAETKSIVDHYLKLHDAAQRKFDADEQSRFSALARQQKIAQSL
ncbi:MAG: DUF922 domain-containing protein [Rhizobiaceae bacterium]|nr:DUF922 domain-containing protein [Rhizobiaceae bacterium]